MAKQIVTACVLGIMVAAVQAASPVGWRTDGTGRYPSAEPVTEWGPDKNVVWKCPMPSWSNSTPVIVGDKIFVCSEPTDLVCISKADGKILWKKSNGYDIVMTAEEKAQADKDKAEVARIRKEELAPLQKQVKDAQAEVAKLTPKPGTQPASAPSDEQKAALAEAQTKLKDLNTQIGAVNAKTPRFPSGRYPAPRAPTAIPRPRPSATASSWPSSSTTAWPPAMTSTATSNGQSSSTGPRTRVGVPARRR